MGLAVFVNSKFKDKVYVVDIERKIYRLVDKSIIKEANFDNEKCKLRNEEFTLEESNGTLAYVNNKNHFYGIFKEVSGKLGLFWITKEHLEEQKEVKISNMVNLSNSLDVSDLGEKVFESLWYKPFGKDFAKPRVLKAFPYRLYSLREFLVKTNLKEAIIKEGEEVRINNDNVKVLDKTEKNTDKSTLKIEDINNTDNNTFNKKDISSGEKFNMHTEGTYMVNNPEKSEQSNTVASVSSIISFGNVPRKKYDSIFTRNLIYEIILKAIKVGDRVTIPNEYMQTVKCYMLKSLESNLSMTKYKSISKIKFSNESPESILAVVDYDEESEFTIITVLKEFNDEQISDNDIQYYTMEYNKLKRRESHV